MRILVLERKSKTSAPHEKRLGARSSFENLAPVCVILVAVVDREVCPVLPGQAAFKAHHDPLGKFTLS